MKLRIKGNSLRLRIPRSELDRLVRDGRVEETIWLGPAEDARLTWSLEHSASIPAATVRFAAPEIAVAFPSSEVERWASGNDVGIYATVDLDPRGSLDLVVEKDFACQHGTTEENSDAFPNPYAATL